MLNKLLLALVPITLALYALHLLGVFELGESIFFVISFISLIPLSSYLGKFTEEVAAHYDQTFAGILNATLGNLAELIIGFLLISKGAAMAGGINGAEIIKASITGAFVGNVLLILGLAFFVAAWKKEKLPIKSHISDTNSTLLMLSVLLLLFPSLIPIFHEEKFTAQISIATASVLFVLYLGLIYFIFGSHKHVFVSASQEGQGGHQPTMSRRSAWLYLLGTAVLLGLVAEVFTGSIESIAHSFGFSELFMGAVVVAFAGNIAEHFSAITFARKGNIEMAINITVGSGLQLIMGVVPLFVFGSYLLGNPMNLVFLPVEIFAIVAAVLLLNEISRDSEITWFEGAQMIALYLIIAVVFFFAR